MCKATPKWKPTTGLRLLAENPTFAIRVSPVKFCSEAKAAA
jgi:hypothetical protein